MLPPALRLQVKRAVEADMAVQEGWAKAAGGGGAHPPFSRAYASGSSDTLQPKPGLGVFRGLAMSRSTCGGHLGTVSRRFPSTAGLLAGMLAEASKKAGVASPALGFLGGGGGTGAGNTSAASAPLPDPSLIPLATELSAQGLDAAYRVVLAKALKRRLAADPNWQKQARRFPLTEKLLLSGALESAAAGVLCAAREKALDLDY